MQLTQLIRLILPALCCVVLWGSSSPFNFSPFADVPNEAEHPFVDFELVLPVPVKCQSLGRNLSIDNALEAFLRPLLPLLLLNKQLQLFTIVVMLFLVQIFLEAEHPFEGFDLVPTAQTYLSMKNAEGMCHH